MITDKKIIDFVKRHEYGTLEGLCASFSAYQKNIGNKDSISQSQLINMIIHLVKQKKLFRVQCGQNNKDGVCIASEVLYDDEVLEPIKPPESMYIKSEDLKRGNIIENQIKLIEFALFKTRGSDDHIRACKRYLRNKFNVAITDKNILFVMEKNKPNIYAEPLYEKIKPDLTPRKTHYTTLDKLILRTIEKSPLKKEEALSKISHLVAKLGMNINASNVFIENSLWFLQYKRQIKLAKGKYIIY
jgi:hypothetical protein